MHVCLSRRRVDAYWWMDEMSEYAPTEERISSLRPSRPQTEPWSRDCDMSHQIGERGRPSAHTSHPMTVPFKEDWG